MINKNRLGLALAAFFGSCHFIWAWLVLAGWAQPMMNWVFRLHLIEPPYLVLPFNLGTAATLILVTSAIGYASGWILGGIWNWLCEDTPPRRTTSTVGRVQQSQSG